jgi:hypothetical protein
MKLSITALLVLLFFAGKGQTKKDSIFPDVKSFLDSGWEVVQPDQMPEIYKGKKPLDTCNQVRFGKLNVHFKWGQEFHLVKFADSMYGVAKKIDKYMWYYYEDTLLFLSKSDMYKLRGFAPFDLEWTVREKDSCQAKIKFYRWIGPHLREKWVSDSIAEESRHRKQYKIIR